MSTIDRDHEALIALRRFGLGPRPGDLAFVRGDPRGYVLSQIEGDAPLAPLPGITDAATGAVLRQRFRSRLRLAERGEGTAESHRRAYRRAHLSDARIWIRHVVETPHGYPERLAMHWGNHLTVSKRQGGNLSQRGPYENEVVRAHALGRFADMLEASSRHPAMLAYLDQWRSTGPNSPIGKRRELGLNENYARELLELHTLGVDGGYAQGDVRALALLLTGWTLANPLRRPDRAGRAVFVSGRHEPGAHEVLGRRYDMRPEERRAAVVADLARHPSTARHVARRMAIHFVAPDPPPSLVAKLERSFLDTDGDLRAMARTLATADEAWAAPVDSFLPPIDYVVALARALPDRDDGAAMMDDDATETDEATDGGMDGMAGGAMDAIPMASPSLAPAPFGADFWRVAMRDMGQRLWWPASPAGYEPHGEAWLGPQAMARRLALAASVAERSAVSDVPDLAEALYGEALSGPTRSAVARAEAARQGLTLLLMAPESMKR